MARRPIAASPFAARRATPTTLGDSAKAVIGSWEFSNADRDKICTATFKSDPTPVGFKVEFDANCANSVSAGARRRRLDIPRRTICCACSMRKGKSLVEFSEVEDGIYEAPTPGVGVLFLQNAAAAGPPPKPPEQVAGDWAIMRGADRRCAL